MGVGKEIWRNEHGDLKVEQDGSNLLFWRMEDEVCIAVSMEELQQIVRSSENPEKLGWADLQAKQDEGESQ